MSHQTKSPEVIQKWIVAWIAKELRIEANQIDLQKPLSYLGMSSRQAILLSGELEDFLERSVKLELLFGSLTLEKFVEQLAQDR